MHLLWDGVRQALRDLDAGRLDLNGLDKACADAQALYERLVVLRHKAREGKQAPPLPEPPVVKEPPPEVATEMPVMRLETRPTEVPPRQTSLIDAIAETETPGAPQVEPSAPATKPVAKADAQAPVRPAAQPAQRPERSGERSSVPKGATLADKLEHAAIPDLHKAIALSQKFWFVAELFGGQRERYEKAIDAINALGSVEDARTFIAKEVVAKAARPPAEDAMQAFNELVDRRFK
jgi:hypothetical protein